MREPDSDYLGDSRRDLNYIVPLVVVAMVLFSHRIGADYPDNLIGCLTAQAANETGSTHCRDSNSQDSTDTIIIGETETVSIVASDSEEAVIGVDGGTGKNHIINYGVITLTVTNSGQPLPPWKDSERQCTRYFDSEDSGANKYASNPLFDLGELSRDAIGISGGQSRDIVENHGLLEVTTTTTLTEQAGMASAYGIGMAGDGGKDHLINNGQMNSGGLGNIDRLPSI